PHVGRRSQCGLRDDAPGHTAGAGCRGTTRFLLVLALKEDGTTPRLLDAPTVNFTFGLLAPNGCDLVPPAAPDSTAFSPPSRSAPDLALSVTIPDADHPAALGAGLAAHLQPVAEPHRDAVALAARIGPQAAPPGGGLARLARPGPGVLRPVRRGLAGAAEGLVGGPVVGADAPQQRGQARLPLGRRLL